MLVILTGAISVPAVAPTDPNDPLIWATVHLDVRLSMTLGEGDAAVTDGVPNGVGGLNDAETAEDVEVHPPNMTATTANGHQANLM